MRTVKQVSKRTERVAGGSFFFFSSRRRQARSPARRPRVRAPRRARKRKACCRPAPALPSATSRSTRMPEAVGLVLDKEGNARRAKAPPEAGGPNTPRPPLVHTHLLA